MSFGKETGHQTPIEANTSPRRQHNKTLIYFAQAALLETS